MEAPLPAKSISPTHLESALSYDAYKQLVDDLLAAGKATGTNHSEAFLHYSHLNQQRMHRLEKTIVLLPEVKSSILSISRPQTWLVLTEGWCGDAAQSLPVMQALVSLNPLIRLRMLLRDENLELMDQYLTNGVSRSIPKLIAMDTDSLTELFTWGPRPAPLQQLFYRMKADGMDYDPIKEELQRWYNTDKTATIQREIAGLASGQTLP
ncbi:MAG TPA: thioredoxin family protein [Puia sp.]|nr:thioredoxin family protein [Puia sp.]